MTTIDELFSHGLPVRLPRTVVGEDVFERQVNDGPPPPRPAFAPTVSEFTIGALLERSDWRAAIDAYAPRCADAWSVVLDRVDELRQAIEALNELPILEQDAATDAAASVTAAIRAGKPLPKITTRDFASVRTALVAERTRAFHAAGEARRKYAETVDEALPGALTAIVEQIAPARAAAREAWAAARPAVAKAHGLLDLAGFVQRQVDPDDLGHVTGPEAQRLVAVPPGALAGLDAWASSDDPVVSGSRFTEASEARPPLYAREPLAHSPRDSDVHTLAVIEHDEQYKITDWTRAEFEHKFRRA